MLVGKSEVKDQEEDISIDVSIISKWLIERIG
jgi:hypothetical protein